MGLSSWILRRGPPWKKNWRVENGYLPERFGYFFEVVLFPAASIWNYAQFGTVWLLGDGIRLVFKIVDPPGGATPPGLLGSSRKP